MTNTKLFQVDEYNVFDDEIEVFLLKDGEEKTLFISRQKFEKWLKEDSRLDWTFDCADSYGEHYQETGTMPVESYFEACTIQEVKTDLYDFIVKKNLFKTPINQILENAFSHI